MAVVDESENRLDQEKDLGQQSDSDQENFDRVITLILFLVTILACVALMYLHSNT